MNHVQSLYQRLHQGYVGRSARNYGKTMMFSNNHEKAAGEADFLLNIRAAIRGLWRGELVLFEFVDTMGLSIRRAYTNAWNAGAATCGILPEELTTNERIRLQDEINSEISHILPFGNDIVKNSKANNGKLGPLLKRADMWAGRFHAIQSIATVVVCPDGKSMWIYDPTKEHCTDCAKLHGRVYRNSVWDRYGIHPRSRLLACEGYKCGCKRIPTTEPVTPGRPPGIAYGYM